MKLSRAISIASQWAEGHLVSLRYGEGQEYHKLCIKALKLMREQGNCCQNGNGSWISVEDELPEPLVDVLVLHENGHIEKEWRFKHNTYTKTASFVYDDIYGDVTHWMPLPEPPEVEE